MFLRLLHLGAKLIKMIGSITGFAGHRTDQPLYRELLIFDLFDGHKFAAYMVKHEFENSSIMIDGH